MENLAGDSPFMDPLGMEGGGEEENAVSYEIIPDPGTGAADLEALRQRVLELVVPFLHGYVWQRESFNLYLSTQHAPHWHKQSRSKGACSDQGVLLWGEVAFGDNVEDEWFIVSLLLRVTRDLPGLSARIWDNDGEFLLIEAAYQLPKWVKPEASTNRVFLRGGRLHLVPLPSAQHPTLPPQPTLDEALQILKSGVVATEAPPGVQDAIHSRIGDLPVGAQKLMHTARLRLPAKCAAALNAEPAAVGPAVEAFYSRDMQDMKAAARQRTFPPQDMVTVLVRFNRCLYAQLSGQPWEPPKGYPMPPTDSPLSKAASLGAKMAAGLEILLSRSLADEGSPSTSRPPLPRNRGGSWEAFLKRLEGLDYFEGELEGSRRYRQLEEAAWKYFGTMVPPEAEEAARELVERIQNAIQGPIDPEQLQAEMGGASRAEDDDGWLTLAAEELQRQMDAREAELEAHTAKKTKPGKGSSDEAKAVNEDQTEMERLTQRMGQFMEHLSGLDGAEVPASADAGGNVDLDPERFLKTLRDVLGIDPTELNGGGDDSSSEGSSFFSDDDDDGESDSGDEGRDGGSQGFASPGVGGFRRVPDWEAETDTDSDDEEGEGEEEERERGEESSKGRRGSAFMQAYSEELEAQLRGTTMAESFERQPSGANGNGGSAAAAAAASGVDDASSGGAAVPEQQGAADKPVDLDLNLVSSLLESYASQEGLPGPAGNLVGMLGLKMPK